MIKEAWSFSVWKAFNHKLYSECLTAEHVVDGGAREHYDQVFKIDEFGVEEYPVEPEQFRECVRVDKGSEKYVLPTCLANELPIKPTSTFDCQLKKSDKKIWKFILEAEVLGISGVKGLSSFKEFVKNWNPMDHSNPTHWTLMKIIAIASEYKGMKCCVCAEPALGKNANFAIINNITRDVCRIQKPTLAKFETVLFYNNVVLPDEITSLKKADVGELEPAVLSIGDNSTEYNKHSMAQRKEMNTVDLVQKSVIFTYNRKQDMKDEKYFFDYKWDSIQAFRSRYPQLLLSGKVLETMPNLNNVQSARIMEKNFGEMRAIAKSFVYWIENLHDHLNHWSRDRIKLKSRHMTNLEALYDALDVYSESQEEFDKWIDVVDDCMKEYYKMLNGSVVTEQGTLNIPETTYEDIE